MDDDWGYPYDETETTIYSTYVAILMGNSMIDPRFIMGNATMNGMIFRVI